jgi:cyclohexanone monooxygenase
VLKTFDVDGEERRCLFDERWQVGGPRFVRAFLDTMQDAKANAQAVAFVHEQIRQTVRDPEVAEKLRPRDHPLGAKRICVDIDYYETYNRDNVTLHDLRQDPIDAVESNGIRLRSNRIDVDDLVFATGFDAMTGALTRLDIRGRGGRSLREEWAAGPLAYLGIGVAQFPNLFILNGPLSPSVFVNMALTSEQQTNWVAGAIDYVRRNGLAALEVQPEAQDRWRDHCSDLVAGSLLLQGNSWYLGANIPGKPRVFLAYVGGFPRYIEECSSVARDGYRGFLKIPATAVARPSSGEFAGGR